MQDWTEFGLRHGPVMSGRRRSELPERLRTFVSDANAEAMTPLVGITVDGKVDERLRGRTVSDPQATKAIRVAAEAFVASLDPQERAVACLPFDSHEWRTWINVHMNLFRHGVMLEELDGTKRARAMDLLAATRSQAGFQLARDVMRLNGLLAELTGSDEQFGEWLYFLTVFGDPSGDQPWGWQLDGHHAVINCVVDGDHLWLTPTFMGSEPCAVRSGRLAGTRVFAQEEASGLELIRSLDADQRASATRFTSIMPDAIPEHLQNPMNGRMQAVSFKDNAVLPYEGIQADGFDATQRGLLLRVIGHYLHWSPETYASLQLQDCERFLEETWFSWYGGIGDEDPFYYRVHSPVVLIEFDHHPGVVFDVAQPTRHHIHTVVRSPNGGDYGADVLAAHYRRFDHPGGEAH